MVKRQYALVEDAHSSAHHYNKQYHKYRMRNYEQHYKQDFFYSLLREMSTDALDAKTVKEEVVKHL
jgi:hypothetical protein